MSRDIIARRDWLRGREARLKDALRTGEIEVARQSISEFLDAAKPGDFDPTRINRIREELSNADRALSAARMAFGSGIVKQ